MNLNLMTDAVWLFVSFAAGIGVAAMGFVQLLKDLTPLRAIWQERWIRDVVAKLARGGDPFSSVAVETAALTTLVRLSVANQTNALFGLPIDQLAGQLNAAAQVVLDYPKKYEELFLVLSAGARPEDITTVLNPPPAAPAPGFPDPPPDPARVTEYVDARNRVANQAQRNLDALQITMSFRWKLYLQLVSIVVSLLLAVVAVGVAGPEWAGTAAGAGFVVGAGLLGGFLATTARDLTAAVQNLRGRG